MTPTKGCRDEKGEKGTAPERGRCLLVVAPVEGDLNSMLGYKKGPMIVAYNQHGLMGSRFLPFSIVSHNKQAE
jgi:hypothetical protein